MADKCIDSFSYEYFFLSNYYESPVHVFGLTFRNNEAAFQSQKFDSKDKQSAFTDVSAYQAKRMGRTARLSANWDIARNGVMLDVVRAKFTQNDTYWGVCDGVGQNQLGTILMIVRSEIAKAQKTG